MSAAASSSAAAAKGAKRSSAANSPAGQKFVPPVKKSKYDTKSGTIGIVLPFYRDDAPTLVPVPSSDGLPEQLAMVRWSSRLPDYLEGESLPDKRPGSKKGVIVVGSNNGGSSSAGNGVSGKNETGKEKAGDEAKNPPSRSLREQLRRLFKENFYDVQPIDKSLKCVGRVVPSPKASSLVSYCYSKVPNNFNTTISYIDGQTSVEATAEEISTKALVIVDEADVAPVLAQHETHDGTLKHDTIKAGVIYRLHKIRVNSESTTSEPREQWDSWRGFRNYNPRKVRAFDMVLPNNSRLLLIAETVFLATATLADNGYRRSNLATALSRAMERELVAMCKNAEGPRGQTALFQSVAAKPTEAAQQFWSKQGLQRCQTVCSLNARADTDDEKKVKEWLQKKGDFSQKDFEGLIWKYSGTVYSKGKPEACEKVEFAWQAVTGRGPPSVQDFRKKQKKWDWESAPAVMFRVEVDKSNGSGGAPAAPGQSVKLNFFRGLSGDFAVAVEFPTKNAGSLGDGAPHALPSSVTVQDLLASKFFQQLSEKNILDISSLYTTQVSLYREDETGESVEISEAEVPAVDLSDPAVVEADGFFAGVKRNMKKDFIAEGVLHEVVGSFMVPFHDSPVWVKEVVVDED